MREYAATESLKKILTEHPYAEDFFTSMGLESVYVELTLEQMLNRLPDDVIEDCGMDRMQIVSNFTAFMQKMDELKRKSDLSIREITLIGGRDKSGNHENAVLTMKPGEILCIVGPTGSGKSRLLADIECLAQRDTPSRRRVFLNGEVPSQDRRFSIEHKLVAQLSQNMNFIMDIAVGEFVSMHAESRMVANIEEIVEAIVGCANELAGETFTMETPITALSGGQSRALMIADTAMLSASPIVLIDEIENAGVDRKKALELLVKKEKIVLMSTHDPILALMGDKRIVIKNGGIKEIIVTSELERANLESLHLLDSRMLEIRNMVRRGERIEFDTRKFLEI